MPAEIKGNMKGALGLRKGNTPERLGVVTPYFKDLLTKNAPGYAVGPQSAILRPHAHLRSNSVTPITSMLVILA